MTAQQPSSTESRDIIFGVYDRLYDHGHCTADVVLAPATAEGEPDWARADPANVEALPADEWPDDEQTARRCCVLISNVDGCDPETAMLLLLRDGEQVRAIQIAGPAEDGDIAQRIIGRDIGAEPPAREPTKLQESIQKLTADLFPPKPPKADNQNDQKVGKFTVTRFRDLGKAKPKPFVVKGVRYAGESSYTAAKPGCGKSVIETDIAYHIATGRDWHGHRVEQGLVIYLAAERKKLQERRVIGLRKHFGDEDRDVPFIILGGKPDLADGKLTDAAAMVELIASLEGEYGMPCRHITVDTLTRTFGGKDQNTSADMSKFIHNVDLFMEAFPDAHINIVHHEGHETGRAKGAIDLDGAVDASFKVSKNGGIYKIACDGANDGVEGDILSFTMQSLEIDIDEDGEPISVPIVVKAANVAGLVEKSKTVQQEAETVAMDILRELSAGEPVGGAIWLARYRETDPEVKEDTMKKRWERAVKAMEADGRVMSSGRPKVYTLPEGQEVGTSEGHVPSVLVPCPSDPSDRLGTKGQGQAPLRGCPNVPVPAEGLNDDVLTDDDIPAFLKGAA